MNILEHKITIENFHRLSIEDLKVVCPIVGDRFLLEDEVKRRNNSEAVVCQTEYRTGYISIDVTTTKVR